jgi:hypothetical protein
MTCGQSNRCKCCQLPRTACNAVTPDTVTETTRRQDTAGASRPVGLEIVRRGDVRERVGLEWQVHINGGVLPRQGRVHPTP